MALNLLTKLIVYQWKKLEKCDRAQQWFRSSYVK